MKRYLVLFACLLILIGCAATVHNGVSPDKRTFRSGVFFLQSPQFSGGGSFDLKENGGNGSLILYSPFGAIVAEIQKKDDSLFIRSGEQLTQVSLADSLSLPYVESVRFGASDLFKLLCGIVPADWVSDGEINDHSTLKMSIEKRGTRVKSLHFSDSLSTVVLEKPERDRYRSVELRVDRRNYFRITYDTE